MRVHRLAAAGAAALAVTVLAACGGGQTAASGGGGGSGDQPYIAIVSKGFQHQFWQAVKKGADQEAAKENVRISFEGPATESDIEAQVTMLTNALAKQPAAIGFAALDSRAAAPLLQQAKTSNIPVIAFDSGVDSDIPLTTAATDNKAAAAEAP
jgi:ribose transport system substrate-binding protein